jgi:hypothetical protein
VKLKKYFFVKIVGNIIVLSIRTLIKKTTRNKYNWKININNAAAFAYYANNALVCQYQKEKKNTHLFSFKRVIS